MAIPELVVFWQCSYNNVWETLRYRDRLAQFDLAMRQASLVRRNYLTGNGLWMFVGPEYAFGRRNRDRSQAAEQVTTEKEQLLLAKMATMTANDHSLLLLPGTIVVRDMHGNHGQARNTSHAYFGGHPVWNFGKIANLGETDSSDHTTNFIPGMGYGMTDIDGTSYGAEICADATGRGTLPVDVDVQVTQGQSVARDDIKKRARELHVIGDYAAPEVWRYRGGHVLEVAPRHTSTCYVATLLYFVTNVRV